jgi:hypothetical protein
MSSEQKAWEMAWCRVQRADDALHVAFCNRLHRSGPWGEAVIADLEADLKYWKADFKRLGGLQYEAP